MPNLIVPAVCRNCHSFFVTDETIEGAGVVAKFKDCEVRCPYCGAMAVILDGTYTNAMVDFVIKSRPDENDLKNLKEIVKENKESPKTAEEISDKIEADIPKFSGVKKFFPSNTAFLGVLSLLVIILSTYLIMSKFLAEDNITPDKLIKKLCEKPLISRLKRPILKPGINSDLLDDTIDKELKMVNNATTNWRDSFTQLIETQKQENYSPALALPSQETVDRSFKWIVKAYSVAPNTFAPDVTPDGDGELHIEWKNENNFITVFIRKDENISDGIVFRKDGQIQALLLSDDTLKEALSNL